MGGVIPFVVYRRATQGSDGQYLVDALFGVIDNGRLAEIFITGLLELFGDSVHRLFKLNIFPMIRKWGALFSFCQAVGIDGSNSQFGKLVDKEGKPGNYYGAW